MTEREKAYLEAAAKVAWIKHRVSYSLHFPVRAFMDVTINETATFKEPMEDLILLYSNRIKWHDFRAAFMAWCEQRRGRGN